MERNQSQTISAALIVRNEERTLARCLHSLERHVDEIVVVDTGSTDTTGAIARRYTGQVFDFPWVDDFSAARQFSFDRCRGDWVFWVDADDVVMGAENIRTLVASAAGNVGGFLWPYIAARDSYGHPRCSFWRERCVRNNGAFRWSGRVHEVLVPTRPAPLKKDGRVAVEHRPMSGVQTSKNHRNLELLRLQIAAEASRGQTDARTLFYLAAETAGAGDLEGALAAYRQCAALSRWDEERCLAHTRRADLLRVLRRFDEAVESDLQALSVQPDWPEAFFGLAETYYYLKDWEKVVCWAELGMNAKPPDRSHITDPMRPLYDWIIFYTVALIHLGRRTDALKWTRHALEICPNDTWHQSNFRWLTGPSPAKRPVPEGFEE